MSLPIRSRITSSANFYPSKQLVNAVRAQLERTVYRVERIVLRERIAAAVNHFGDRINSRAAIEGEDDPTADFLAIQLGETTQISEVDHAHPRYHPNSCGVVLVSLCQTPSRRPP
jgi:hypothetical protein